MVDQRLMTAWLAARSLARGLPAPVADSGGARVDTGSAAERCRYVFAEPGPGLIALGRSIDESRIALKLCRSAEELRSLLPARWRVSGETWVMGRRRALAEVPYLPSGYRLAVERDEHVVRARVLDDQDVPAATGFAAELGELFIYDRIVVEEAHRRKGLGRALMAALMGERRDPESRELLVATALGRQLYLILGWSDLAPYSTAIIPG